MPNVDGAHDDSSDDEPDDCEVSKRANKKDTKYKPLLFRSKKATNVAGNDSTTFKLLSPSSPPCFPIASSSSTTTMPQVNYSTSNDSQLERRSVMYSNRASITSPQTGSVTMSNDCEYADALYAMSYLSPLPFDTPKSPPRPETPIKEARVIIRPLLEDISTYEAANACKVKLNSKRVLLKSLEEEISTYQSQNNRKLRLSPSVPHQLINSKQDCRKRKRRRIQVNTDKQEKQVPDKTTQMKGKWQDLNTSLIDITFLPSQKMDSSWNLSTKAYSMTVVKERKVSEIQPQDTEQIVDEESIEYDFEEIEKETDTMNDNKMAINVEVVSQSSMTEEDTKTIVDSQCNNMVDETEKIEDSIHEEASEKDTQLSFTSSFIPNNFQCSRTSPEPSISDDSSGNCENDSVFELKSSHSMTMHPSRSSSCLPFFTDHCDSSNSILDDESSYVLQDNVNVHGSKTPPTPLTEEGLEIQQQVLHPSTVYATATDGPSSERVTSTMYIYDIPSKDNCTAFWGDANDLPSLTKSKDIRRQSVLIGSNLICHLPEFGASLFQVIRL